MRCLALNYYSTLSPVHEPEYSTRTYNYARRRVAPRACGIASASRSASLRSGDSSPAGAGGRGSRNKKKRRRRSARDPRQDLRFGRLSSTLGTRSTGFRPGRICLRSSARIMRIYGNSFRLATPRQEREREREREGEGGREGSSALAGENASFH